MRSPRPRGFTLTELVVAMTVTVIVMSFVIVAVNAQQKSYYDGQMQRAAQGSARAGLLFLEQKLRLAGYGVDPALAFDFGTYAPSTPPLCPAQNGTCPRDAVNNNDELVFYSRNPNYWVPADPTQDPRGHAWRIVSVVGGNLTISARQGDTFPKGQILAAVCRGGRYYAFMTVGATIPALAADNPNQVVALDPAVPANPFRRQDLADQAISGALRAGCFQGGLARLFQVDRYRFHVRPVPAGGGFAPYLVLDMGVDLDGNGVVDDRDEMLVAEGVEIMQVAYGLANPNLPVLGAGAPIATTAAAAGTFGATTSNTLTTSGFPGAAPPLAEDSVYAPTSFYLYALGPPPDPPRLTDHQANVRQVRVAVVVRSPAPDLRARTPIVLDAAFRIPNYNLTSVPAWITASAYPGPEDGYMRILAETRVVLPNMTARGMTYF
jgi:type IV pilus assembly protein PilW